MELILIVKPLAGILVTVPSNAFPQGLMGQSLPPMFLCTLWVQYTVLVITQTTILVLRIYWRGEQWNANEQIRAIWSMINWSFRQAFLVRMAIISLHVNVKTPFHLFSHYCRAIDQPCWGQRKNWAGGLPPCPMLATGLPPSPSDATPMIVFTGYCKYVQYSM